jgi:hypothetical protein
MGYKLREVAAQSKFGVVRSSRFQRRDQRHHPRIIGIELPLFGQAHWTLSGQVEEKMLDRV